MCYKLVSKPLLLVAAPPSPSTTQGIAFAEREGLSNAGGPRLQEPLSTTITVPAALRQFTA